MKNLTWQNPEQLFVAQELINKVKSKCCGIKDIENERTMYGLAYEARKFNGERDYVWPLPTAELDTNKKLVQHDLWK